MNIRPARLDSDCQGIADVVNAFETAPIPLDMVQQWFEQTAPGRITQRRVAVNDQDEVIGYSVVAQETWSPDYHFYVWVGVDPQWRGNGVGASDGSAYTLRQPRPPHRSQGLGQP